MESEVLYNIYRANHIGAEYLLTALDIGIRCLDLAALATSEETVRGLHECARSAYRHVVYLLPNLKPTEQDGSSIEQKLAGLRFRLPALAGFPEFGEISGDAAIPIRSYWSRPF